MKRIHIVLKDSHRNEASAQLVIKEGSLTNVNESRLIFFKYGILTADATDEGFSKVKSLIDIVQAVEVDGTKSI